VSSGGFIILIIDDLVLIISSFGTALEGGDKTTKYRGGRNKKIGTVETVCAWGSSEGGRKFDLQH
jgi:hypothetical protein